MEFVIGGLAATSAGLFTNPLEVVKHHMELSKKSQMNNKYKAFFDTGLQVAKHDGLKSLQKGLSPALGAYLVSYGMKLGTYQLGHSQGLTTDANGRVVVLKSIMTSCSGGLLGQYLSNPFYLLKYQHEMDVMQHNANCNNDKKHVGYLDTIQRIYRENGIRGFFRGATASLPRAFIGTSQLTSFALAKEILNSLETFRNHPLFTTMVASVVAGIVLSMAMTPFDVVLTKMYKQAIISKSDKEYLGYLDCIKKIYKKNGLKPFYRGMGPLYLKMGPHTVLCLVFWEELKGVYANHSERTNNDKNNYSTVPTQNFYEQIFYSDKEINRTKFNESIEENVTNFYWN
ncbi:hypothetical protein NQ315_005166 [Exocentrus adspersus]|uniref:Mitochondrial carrier protein n=1 Tax=Exocentrus adspersus TaxID=1586481 RepID=A0AAV8VTP0_9CUCU|nr:hypothetical protein NQ315_005166 [Exocentrus adspersus]